ncbi:MAG TPA: acyltransferase [Alcanivorax sp.]|jgi:N-carbamoylputrescine amidase|uniref:Carbon-nitrogen hydrolase family protein n=1 Tax=Alloalcanivorax venustensis ISO4 TaxID=1177184 RepID=A0ABS0AJM0_9GAMM|nr:carbon-nitrogen hydrolase [Alloalcanivorax venustensis]MBF5053425.1 carbon-nitrogen hydrolase family protein [Alloalcanivorax venustensis ISO4]MCH9784576.1 carbon-nitrogen hydrolase [Gammaproteobacteria bacterium]HAB04932.1 acyltransferase [Alcanivorax sp.]HAR59974.1 acyltransferase [Alcanivorax sp.]|tara:strand:+ start:18319 stop:19212 length:894 start_codon:yes stop_codon:yes gene_type:complete
MRVAVIQQQNTADLDANLARSMDKIREAVAQGAQLVMLQELHRSLYFCQSEDTAMFDLAETVPGPSTDALGALARELQVVIVASLFEKRATGLYHNTAVVLESDGHLAGLYRKMHIPDDPGFYEKFYFTPGDATFNAGHSGFTPIRTSVGKLGLLVCWDQWYPEAARLMALAGADLLLYPTAIGWDRSDDPEEQNRQLDAWITVQRAHAVANGLPVLVANRTGFEPGPDGNGGIDFWGNSFVCGPQGEYLARADRDQEQTLVVDLDMARSEEVRRIWPYLRDRRVDAYQDLTKRYRD